jgi:hypothetical protein
MYGVSYNYLEIFIFVLRKLHSSSCCSIHSLLFDVASKLRCTLGTLVKGVFDMTLLPRATLL